MNEQNICIKTSDVFSYFGKNFKKREAEGSFISCISDCNPTPVPHDYSILVYTYKKNVMEFAFLRQECLGSALVGLTSF
jgi:hypothetical protein